MKDWHWHLQHKLLLCKYVILQSYLSLTSFAVFRKSTPFSAYSVKTYWLLFQPCIPVFTTALTLILRTEKFHILKVIGIIFSAAGAVVMVHHSLQGCIISDQYLWKVGVNDISFASSQTRGMICLVGNTLAMSVYYIFQKPVLQRYPPISVTGYVLKWFCYQINLPWSWAYIIGSVEMGLTSLYWTHGHPDKYGIDHRVIVALVYSIVFATILSYPW